MKVFRYLLLLAGLIASVPVLAQKSNVVKFGLCTDLHIPTMHDSEYRLTTFVEAMKKENPDFIIELGDFGIPKPEYQKAFDIWNSFPGEKHHVIGNHEMDGGTSKERAIEYRNMSSSYYSFDKKGFHFIVLDGNDKKDSNAKGYQQFIGQSNLPG
ncbi:MAG: hypothetical protein C0433_12975 [Cyclobacterium sp.]|nr:hypothetical protein [Cyclobacterium sp.]